MSILKTLLNSMARFLLGCILTLLALASLAHAGALPESSLIIGASVSARYIPFRSGTYSPSEAFCARTGLDCLNLASPGVQSHSQMLKLKRQLAIEPSRTFHTVLALDLFFHDDEDSIEQIAPTIQQLCEISQHLVIGTTFRSQTALDEPPLTHLKNQAIQQAAATCPHAKVLNLHELFYQLHSPDGLKINLPGHNPENIELHAQDIFVDEVHTNKYGAEILAEYIEKIIRP